MSLSLLAVGVVLVAVTVTGGRSDPPGHPISGIKPCPNTPNCVSSRGPEGPRKMSPIRYRGSLDEARQRLLEIVRSFQRATVVRNDATCLTVEFRSAIFSFVDDVDFEFDAGSKVIHFRSASRVGYYDFGVNRRRMETIGLKFLSMER